MGIPKKPFQGDGGFGVRTSKLSEDSKSSVASKEDGDFFSTEQSCIMEVPGVEKCFYDFFWERCMNKNKGGLYIFLGMKEHIFNFFGKNRWTWKSLD